MDGDVKVLLVTAGASPDALIAELVRLGVTITECSFAEAEENLETDPPDLVALSGALGAVELANMIDDLEDGPRMVIVAERKELAKLRGLNREVVVSLFAMETTERVVGQRIESLARRAARRRQQKAAPEPSLQKKTSLGLPLASSPVGRVDLKKPPLAKAPESGKDRPEPLLDPIGVERPGPDQQLTIVGRPPAPNRSAAQESAGHTALDSIPVMDDDLLESIRPGESDDDSADLPVQLPINSPMPLSDIEVLAHPPTLPPAAKAQKKEPLPSFGNSRGDLDLSEVEDALESLEGAKSEITPDLVDHAQKEMSAQPVRPEESADAIVLGEQGTEAPLLKSERPVEQELREGEPLGPEPVSTGSMETSDRAAAERDRGLDPLAATSLADGSVEPAVEAPEAALQEPTASGGQTPTKKSGGAGWFWAAIFALGAGVLVYKVAGGGSKSSATGGEEKELTQAPSPSTAPDSAAPDSAAPDSAAPDGSPSPLMNDAGESASDQRAIGANKLSNPFQRPDVNKPSCEVLLQANKVDTGKDPVHEASVFWQEARAAIVAGKKELAHVLMCQAVTLNPESAAIEGLAQHYLSEGAYSEARVWAEKAEALRPGQREVSNLRGDIYGMMGDTEKARAIWLSTLNLRPEEKSRIAPVSKDYSVEAGRHLRRGDLVRAELFFRRAIILDSENVSGMIGLAKVYQRMNDTEYARAFSEMSLRVSDHIPEVHVLLGELSLQEGNRAEAKTHFERALSVRPDFYPAKRGLSQVKQ